MNLVIIGFGGMGGYHAQCLKSYAETNPEYPLHLIGVYDIKPERGKAAEELGLRAYASAEEVWADRNVDAVLIATPNDFHLPYAEAAAKAGKHIISEKPIALSSAEAKKMYAAAEKAGVVFEVHQNRRWDEDYLTVKNIVDTKAIGEVYCIESRVMGGNGIPGDWRKIQAQGGGMMLDWGVHLIDQMLLMINSPIRSLYCEYSYIYGEEVDDGFNLTVDFENGIKYRIVVATDCFRNLPRWQVYGTEGTATIRDWDLSGGMTHVVVREDAKIKGIKAGNGFTRTMAPRVDDTVKELPLPIVRAEPFAFYKNFVAACAGKEEKAIRREEVLRVMHVMESAALSAHKNVVIKKCL